MLDLVIELHKPLDRLGPGSVESTNRALDFVEGLGSMERVLDLGCGTGAQTMTLAERIPGSITGIDRKIVVKRGRNGSSVSIEA